MIQIRESTSRVRVCESRANYLFNQSSGGYSFASKAIAVSFARRKFLLPPQRKTNAVKFIVLCGAGV